MKKCRIYKVKCEKIALHIKHYGAFGLSCALSALDIALLIKSPLYMAFLPLGVMGIYYYGANLLETQEEFDRLLEEKDHLIKELQNPLYQKDNPISKELLVDINKNKDLEETIVQKTQTKFPTQSI